MQNLYIDPPHLTVAVYADRPEIETFALMGEVAVGLGCTPIDLLDLAPRSREFELLSDLGDERILTEVTSARRAQLVAGEDAEVRALRAGYYHPKFGNMVVEYMMRAGTGPHPIGISMASDVLGLPASLWSQEDRCDADSIAAWSTGVLQSAVSKVDPLYGAIGVEFSLPTPQEMATYREGIVTELFVSHKLLDPDQLLFDELKAVYVDGVVTEWSNGVFFAGWAPYTSRHATDADMRKVKKLAAEALARALTRG